jgi:hypothetical protein
VAATDVEIPLEDGPWDGMLDSISPTAKAAGKYLLGQNIYPLDPDIAEAIVGRPGVRQLGAQLGAAANRRCQGTFQFTKKSTGFEATVQICGGKFYTYDWGLALWSEVLTTAQLAAAGIIIDPYAQIAFLNFADRLIVSDGVHDLWDWNGTTGAGLRNLVNSEPMFGPIRAAYARVVGISALNRDTILWSQTDDATTGYRAGGFNNAWSLTQNDPNSLFALLTTNNVTYVLRARSGLPLEGAPGDNWLGDNTQDSISDTYGTLSPFAAILHDVNAMVLDAALHPQFLRPGGAGFIPIWREMRETTKRISKNPAFAAKCMTVFYSPAQLFLIAYPDSGANECNACLVYDAKGELPRAVAVWRGWEMTSMAMVKDGSGAQVWIHGDSNGFVYLHGNPEDDNFITDDNLSTGVVAIEHILEQQPQGYATKTEKIFDRADFTVRPGIGQMTLQVSLATPYGSSAEQQVVLGTASTGFDDVNFDEATFDATGGQTTQEIHGDVGLDGFGRWGKLKLRHATIGEQFGLEAIRLAAYVNDDDPEAP